MVSEYPLYDPLPKTLINLTKEQQEQAMGIKDALLTHIYNKSKNWGFII